MPRPKRPRVVHTVPTLRGEKLTTSTAQSHLGNVSPASSGRVTNATDDSDGLVTTQKLPAGTRRPVNREGFTMTGALGDEEPEGTRLRPPSKRTVEEANRIAREAKYASIAADRRKAREVNAMDSSDQVQIPSTLLSGAGVGQGSRAESLAVQSRRPSIMSRGQQTPLTHSSSLGLAFFKKRPRQPSLLQMAQLQNMQNENSDNEDDDLDDFRPVDESTPYVKSQSQVHTLESSSSRQTSGSRKRKLATPEAQLQASQSENVFSSPSTVLSQPLALESHGPPEEPVSLEPALPQPLPPQSPASEIFSDTLAPPQSSSSPPPPVRSKRTTTRKASAQPVSISETNRRHQTDTAAPSRPPHATTPTTSSPVRQPLRPLTTATLQNLLPRRRTRQRPPRGAFDFPSSSEVELDTTHLGEDEDELSFHSTSKLRRKPKTPARSTQQSTKKSTTKAKAKTKETPAPATEKGSKRISKTYARQHFVEIDGGGGGSNDEDEDDSLGPASLKKHAKGKAEVEFDGKAKREMERLAKKFAEVDDYALDFEDMTGSSSQMADAR